MPFDLLAALTLGLFSSIHCLGMCGGIIGALTMSLAPEVRGRRNRVAVYVTMYNLGRVLSYGLIGLAAGLVGQGLSGSLQPAHGFSVLRILATVLVIGAGLYLAGWFPRFAAIERIGAPVWKRLEPLGRRLLPVRSLGQAFLFGTVWGWLPCGMVYSAVLLAIGQGRVLEGGLFMAAFGVGTLPSVAGAGTVAGIAGRLRRIPNVNRAMGLILIVLAVGGLWYSTKHPILLGN